ncbi:hypothetical protein Ahy_A07g036442 isoform A [Arachis hypogaea]|uniref:Transposase MuDR plant domain-containing protein n=1 Tax=Arachis hypogaea TaxID=3818 RepID=A0A445CG89_ARAHY|nr:hypothetical protein Ahy_A07g036442 isoform A [Arachis hypogaea]
MELFVEVGDDDPPLAPLPIHVASPVEDMDVDDEDSDENYVTDNNNNGSFDDDDEEDFIPKMSAEAAIAMFCLPPSNSGAIRCTKSLSCIGSGHNGVKNYSIRRSAEYRVVESDQLEYHMHCYQSAVGCPWSLHGGPKGWWSAYVFSTHHVPRPSTVGQHPHLQCHPAVDIVQLIRQYPSPSRCSSTKLSLQNLV